MANAQIQRNLRLSPCMSWCQDCAPWWCGCPTVWSCCSSSSSSCHLFWSAESKKSRDKTMKGKEATRRWRTWVSQPLSYYSLGQYTWCIFKMECCLSGKQNSLIESCSLSSLLSKSVTSLKQRHLYYL